MSVNTRKLWTIHGGVHPPFHKDDSTSLPIKDAGIPPQLIVSLHQHTGAAAEPVVKAGDRVNKGQIIATAAHNSISANIHAPTSGLITAIEERILPHPSHLADQCIIIDTDGKDSWVKDEIKGKLQVLSDYQSIKPEILLERIQQAGVVGLGGAVFPTAVKMAGAKQNPIDTFIINSAECEPYITCDDMLMRERSAEIIIGIRIIQHMITPTKCLIGIEDNKPQAIKIMTEACKNDTNIEVVSVPTIYPSGDIKQLTKILTGIEIPAGTRSVNSGILGLNVGTVYSIFQAVVEAIPAISRITTVTGNGVIRAQNFETLIGTPFSWLAKQAGGLTKMADHLIMGGPMMGFAIDDDATPIVKATNCALFISSTQLRETNSAFSNQPTIPCIRCGKCMDACPVNLLPQQMYWHIRAKDFEKAQAHHLKDCIECGCCSYVCPSHIPLVDYYRFAKNEIREQKVVQTKADLSRDRHEFLLFRKERDKRERDEKRAAHKAALQEKKAATSKDGVKSTDNNAKNGAKNKADAIKAAMARAKAKKDLRAKESSEKNVEVKVEKEAKTKDEI
jgi:electron transport complex protein RnfC